MKHAMALAQRAQGQTAPNPLVGAILVKRNQIVGQGFHHEAGSPHAEILAIQDAGKNARGATLYVTLEPCSTYGKTPPCTSAIRTAGIRHVVYGSADANPRNANRAARILKRFGIGVSPGILEAECRDMNRAFNAWIKKKKPHVVLKMAQSFDGKTIAPQGESRWITSAEARRDAQRIRKASDAILVGIETVRMDDPGLDVRIPTRKFPMKVILDSRLRINAGAKVFKTPGRVILAATKKSPAARRALLSKNAAVWILPSRKGRVDLKSLLRRLAKNNVMQLMVEGGRTVADAFIDQGLADELCVYVSPKIYGARKALFDLNLKERNYMMEALALHRAESKSIGKDTKYHGYF
jgi:diaminohydroxyphosphoribosylaminopyrimidine deaminase/5-amino-6-(5-phosphoribosylamino)uracil reductase